VPLPDQFFLDGKYLEHEIHFVSDLCAHREQRRSQAEVAALACQMGPTAN
jgi:hypothetical protein